MQLPLATALFLSCFLTVAVADLDPNDSLSEADFEATFHVLPDPDPAEEAKRASALKTNEEIVKEVNEAYQAGRNSWFDAINEWANLPTDEFVAEKTGLLPRPEGSQNRGRGLLEPSPEARYHEPSERHFDQFRYECTDTPDSYSSVDLGFVTRVRDQMNCGSCTAFASLAAMEVCYKKLTGLESDYSEQELVDCGYGTEEANGCNGAPLYSYLTWANTSLAKPNLAQEGQYPYLNKEPRLACPAGTPLPSYNRGASMTGVWYTYEGDETLLKNLVYKYGAVLTSFQTQGPFDEYAGGIFAGCGPDDKNRDHAVTVVGYGSEAGLDYWLVKNSWGPRWGEGGYFRIKRGVAMCGIGDHLVTVDCGPLPADIAIDPLLPTDAPCVDKYSVCDYLANNTCFQLDMKIDCPKSCGLCPGMTPAASNTCYDVRSTCEGMCETYKEGCDKTCGLC